MTEFALMSASQHPGFGRTGPIGRDHRHAGERQLERHRARFGERRTGDPERRPLFLLADHHPRLHRPAPPAPAVTASCRCGMVGRTSFEGASLPHAAAQRLRRIPPYDARSRCGDFRAAPEEPAAARPAAVVPPGWAAAADLFGQGMTDIAAGRPAQPAIFLRFERQQGQHVIDIGAHRACPAGPPRPDRGRHVIDDRDRGIAGPNASCHPMGEVGAVDDHEDIGRGSATASAVRGSAAGSSATASRPLSIPMIDSSSIGNSEAKPSRAIDWPPTPSNCTASPSRWRNTFIRLAPSRSPDSSVAIRKIFARDVGRGPRRHHADRPGHEQARLHPPPRSWPAVRPRSYCRRRPQCRQARPQPRLRRSADPSSADRSANPDRSSAPSPARRAPVLARIRPSCAQPRDPRQQAVGALDVFHADHMTVDDDRGLTDVERTRARAARPAPSRYRPPHFRPAPSAVRHPSGISRSGATSLMPTMRKPSCSRMRPIPDSR